MWWSLMLWTAAADRSEYSITHLYMLAYWRINHEACIINFCCTLGQILVKKQLPHKWPKTEQRCPCCPLLTSLYVPWVWGRFCPGMVFLVMCCGRCTPWWLGSSLTVLQRRGSKIKASQIKVSVDLKLTTLWAFLLHASVEVFRFFEQEDYGIERKMYTS